jgi:UDP-2-acetamido-3-amino-2,3-dideoxy-glucuronate N-acetyltransferase
LDGPQVGVAVLGCGRWGINHVRVWRELGCLRIVCDSDELALETVRGRWPGINTTSDVSEALTRPDVSAVVVATPAATHATLALEAMLAGKDVLIEKPMALDVADAERIDEVSTRLGRVVAVGHVLEHHPAVSTLLDLIANGALGRVRYVSSHRLNFGRIRTEANALWSFAPHDISIILQVMRAAPVDVTCRGGSYVTPGVADVSVTTLGFPGAAQAHLFTSWLHPYKDHRIVVVGDQQMAVFDDTAPWPDKLMLFPHAVEEAAGGPVARRADGRPVPLTPAEPLEVECADFLECVRHRRRPRVDATQGLRTIRVLQAAQRSLDEGGRPCPIRPAAESHIHPSAWVHPAARLGTGVRIWHHSTVLEEASIGDGSMLGQNSFVGRRVRIGHRVRIQNNVSVYEGVELDDDVFCGPSTVFTNVERPRAHIDRSADFQRTSVGRGATLGANSTIVCGVSIGQHAFVGAGAVVTGDVPDHALVVGVPARTIGWVCICGERLMAKGDAGWCERCSAQFVGLEQGAVRLLEPRSGTGEGRPA